MSSHAANPTKSADRRFNAVIGMFARAENAEGNGVMETVDAPKPKPLRMTILTPFACPSPVIVSASAQVPRLFVFYKTGAK
jgi:hypothetical protein